MESSLDKDNEYNWLKVITRNSNRTDHPVKAYITYKFFNIKY